MTEIPTTNIMKDDFGWEVPVEIVPLPSQGKTYSEESGIHGVETVKIRAMTAQEEDILSSRALIQEGTVISHLLKSCLVDKRIDAQNMMLGDRNALMIAIRITGYGSAYHADASCENCGDRSSHEFNLGDLEIKRLDIEPVSAGSNLFEFSLPVTKKTVHFSFLTGADEEELGIIADRKKKMMPGLKIEDGVTSRLTQSIKAVDSVTDRAKIAGFVRNMPARDSRALRAYMKEKEPGIDMNAWIRCPSCSEDSKISLPLGIGFFWPDK